MFPKILLSLLSILLLCIAVLLYLYFQQEKYLFYPTKLSKEYRFEFREDFEEINLKTSDNILLNNLLFTTSNSKGVVLFLHGNAGAIHDWGNCAPLYLENGYDVFFADYRAYGKSGGHISSEAQLVQDAQLAYDYLVKKYGESRIIVSGTSIGTGIATQIAANNKPKKLILNSPYFSLVSLVKEKAAMLPSFLLRYPLDTNQHLDNVSCPIVVYHGEKDALIPQDHAFLLLEHHRNISLHIINDAGHNDLFSSEDFVGWMRMELGE